VLGVLTVPISGALVAAGIAFLTSDAGKDFQSCVQNANTQAERQKCADDFQHKLTN
jgi:hypothetical protein